MPDTFTSFFLRCGKDKFDAILFDIDGTLSSGGHPLPGAEKLLTILEEKKFPYMLLTNDSCNSRKEKAAILQKGSLPVTEERIYSCGDVLKFWQKENYHGELFFQCGKLGTPSYAHQAGIRVTTDPAQISECSGVIFGDGDYDWKPALEAVFNFFLSHPEAPMIVVTPDSYWPSFTSFGKMCIGGGAQARFICATLKDAGITVEPLYIGKPYPQIYQGISWELKELLGHPIPPERIAMVGDSLDTDIRGANINGLCSCLVLSGITTVELAAKAENERKPRMIFSAV